MKPDKKDGRLVCAECKTALPEGACWCPKCGPENPDGCQQGYCTAKPDDREPDAWMAHCPATRGRLMAYTEHGAREQGEVAYSPHEFFVVPLFRHDEAGK